MTHPLKIKAVLGFRVHALQSSGMTLLEVLIAVLLFAVFAGTFLMVTEMVGQLLPAEQAPVGDGSCNGPAFEESCVNIAFDVMVPYLEKSQPDDLLAEIDVLREYESLDDVEFAGIRDLQLAWPDAYRLEILQWSGLSQAAFTDQYPSRPGLYLLQATPKPEQSAFWRKPIQRVFCRPYHRCV